MADPYDKLPQITYWLMGSLSAVNFDKLAMIIIPLLIGMIVILVLRWHLNLLAMGDEEAQSLGLDAGKLRLIIIVACTLVTSAAVSISGIIGWVGLVVPHMTRIIVGPDHKILLPASISIGASFLLLIDNISRTFISIEIPIGMVKLVEVKDVSFSYDKDSPIVFENISFSIEKGDVLCILGPNGTGKTTLIKTINGLHEVNSGSISLNGTNIKELSYNDIAKIVGYIPQGHIPSFPFKVFDVVLMGRSPYINLSASPKEEDKEIALNALKTLGIEDLKDKSYTNLSGGERQLVFLARVLAQEPDLLILDEPTNHLDFGNQIKLLEMIEQLSQLGLAVIMSSHYPDHAFLAASKVAIMKDRTFIDFGTPEDVLTEENLNKAYGIDVKLVELEDNRKICVPLKTNLELVMSNYSKKYSLE